MNQILICIDRDGTLIWDGKPRLFLGKDNDWPSMLHILPSVIEGLKKLKDLPQAKTYMITNQPGVAISDYPLLTLERAHEVCRHVLGSLNELGARFSGYFLCPHAPSEYVRDNPNVTFDSRFVQECQCFKPRPGMVYEALEAENLRPEDAHIYVIGDRATDVAVALHFNGFGILTPFENESGQIERTRNLDSQEHIFIARDMVHAADFILTREMGA